MVFELNNVDLINNILHFIAHAHSLARSLPSSCLLNLIMINDSTLCLGLIFGIHNVDPILFIIPNNTQNVYTLTCETLLSLLI